jgi:L-lactate dehydrogenase complex protein LldG
MTTIQPSLRDAILDSVRQNQPAARPMPVIPRFRSDHPVDLVATFRESVARMAGDVVSDVQDLNSFIRDTYPDAHVTCSATPEYKGTIRPGSFNHWSEASTIDVCVVRSPMGVAETGSVLLSDVELQVNTIAFLAHDLIVLLDPGQIVENIHQAYEHPYFKVRPYSLLMTGPSGSADIAGITVHPALGVKTLTVILSPDPKRVKAGNEFNS